MKISHWGSDIVAHEKVATKKIAALALERDVEVFIAYDNYAFICWKARTAVAT